MRLAISSLATLCVDHWPAAEAKPGTPTCVLIHGFSDNSAVWRQVAPQLAAFCHVLAPNLRGHGGSDWAGEGPYTCAEFANDIMEILDLLAIENVILIGHSMGGNVALVMCHALKRRVLGAMLVDSSPRTPPEVREQILRDFVEGDRAFASADDYLTWLQSKRPLSDPEAMQSLASESLEVGLDGAFRRRCDPSMAGPGGLDFDLPAEFPDPVELIASLDCELYILRGRLSGVLDRKTQFSLAAAAKRATCKEVEMAGHAVMSDNPAGFRQIAIEFVKRVAMTERAFP